MTTTDPVTLALTGQFPFVLGAGAVFSLPLSLLLLRLYQRAVIKRMNARSEQPASRETPAPHNGAGPEAATSGDLSLTLIDAAAEQDRPPTANAFFQRAVSAPRRAGFVYGAAGTVFAAIMAFCFLRSSSSEFLPVRFLILLWTYSWPLVLTLPLVTSARHRTKLLPAALHAVGFVILSAVGMARSPDVSAGQLVALWLITNIPPTVLVLVFLMRRVRAVGPLVVTFMVLSLTGSTLILSLAGSRQELLRSAADVGFSLGLSGTGVFWGITLIGFLLFAVLGWIALRGIRAGYRNKLINDQSLILDALWLLCGLSYSIGLAFEGAVWILSGLTAFAAYKAVTFAGFRLLKPAGAPRESPRLLVLRVFSLGKRSESLFDALTRHWRYLGQVQLISGPDLTAATVEPHEFLAFLSGRLDGQFIDGPASLERRLREMDTSPDFDGRFRVNDFFCHDDTWRMTLARLLGTSDVVLMDLRGFSPQNAGCAYELHELVGTAPLERVVIAIDATTDAAFMDQTLRDAWAAMPAGSPNRTTKAHVQIMRLTPSGDQGLTALLGLLCTAAEGANA